MTNEEKAYEQALQYLSRRNYSTMELRNKLKRKEYSQESIAKVLERLEKNKLVDDDELAEQVYRRFYEDGIYGNSYIRYKMEQKGLVMPRSMSTEEEVRRALCLVENKLLRNANSVTERKTASFLANRGYGRHVGYAVFEVLRNRGLLDSNPKKNYNE